LLNADSWNEGWIPSGAHVDLGTGDRGHASSIDSRLPFRDGFEVEDGSAESLLPPRNWSVRKRR